jgi:phosphoribosyl-AMP cyclohydrolase
VSETRGAEGAPFAVAFDAAGLVPVVAQEGATGAVLLLAWMNAEALARTLAEGVLVFWSRSRQTLWRKGERSGNTLRLRELRVNCEGNSLLALVELEGAAACHEGYRSCYYRRLDPTTEGAFTTRIIAARQLDPATVNGAHAPAATDADDAADAALERNARALYAAYERLRDGPAVAESATARLLQQPDGAATAAHALARAREELAELRGVLAGTHRHHGDARDVILEAGQVGYWAAVAAVALGAPYAAWQPHRAWLAGWRGAGAPSEDSEGNPLGAAAAALTAAGALCHAAAVHPARVVAADLAAMRARHGE